MVKHLKAEIAKTLTVLDSKVKLEVVEKYADYKCKHMTESLLGVNTGSPSSV